jgi:AcrR family transcriptional regulator
MKGRAIEVQKAPGRSLARRRAVRSGRPPREHAGSVDERILDAAAKVFLERGFSGASVDEIAEVARAGKPTIYARFPNKEALFMAVIERLARRYTNLEATPLAGETIEERLQDFAAGILTRALAPETIGLARMAVAEARRFRDVAASVSRATRERNTAAVTRFLAEIAESDRARALPAFNPDRLPGTARRFLDLVVAPMLWRALFGEDLAAVRADIGPQVAHSVAFFLAACRPPHAAQ